MIESMSMSVSLLNEGEHEADAYDLIRAIEAFTKLNSKALSWASAWPEMPKKFYLVYSFIHEVERVSAVGISDVKRKVKDWFVESIEDAIGRESELELINVEIESAGIYGGLKITMLEDGETRNALHITCDDKFFG